MIDRSVDSTVHFSFRWSLPHMQMHTDYSAEALEGFSKKQLQDICRHHKVGVSGNKPDLVDRILNVHRGGRQGTLDGFLNSNKVKYLLPSAPISCSPIEVASNNLC